MCMKKSTGLRRQNDMQTAGEWHTEAQRHAKATYVQYVNILPSFKRGTYDAKTGQKQPQQLFLFSFKIFLATLHS